MEKIKPILWRIYLTWFSLVLTGVVISTGYFLLKSSQTLQKRQFLEKFIEGEEAEIQTTLKPRSENSKLSAEEYLELQKLTQDTLVPEIDCVKRSYSAGTWLYPCYQSDEYVPQKVKAEGIERTTSLSYADNAESLILFLGLLIASLIGRYWIAWLSTGRFPRSFP